MESGSEFEDSNLEGDEFDEPGDLSLSISSSEFNYGDSTDENVVQPFLYEPEAASTSSSDNEGEIGTENSQSSRLNNTDWCSCGKCVPMLSSKECICCMEIDQMRRKLQPEAAGVSCICLHPGFQSVCLNIHVLETAYFSYRQHYGGDATQGNINNQRRHTAYRQLTRWCWEWLGQRIRVVLPSCAVNTIREEFPSENGIYVGYKDPNMSD